MLCLAGDVSHLTAIVILFVKIWRSESCAGISGKSQVLFAVVFTTRYLDLFTRFFSVYNTVMKVVFQVLAYTTVHLIYMRFRNSYDSEKDSLKVEFLVIPVAVLSFLVNYTFSPLEILWTFSIYLESVAVLPQLFMIAKTWEAEFMMMHYLFFLWLYRALYVVNWVWMYYTMGLFDHIAFVSGVVQIVFYCGFFYLYFTRDVSAKSGVKNNPGPAPFPIVSPSWTLVSISPPTCTQSIDLSGVPSKNYNKELQIPNLPVRGTSGPITVSRR